jgi:hypothetical protein
LASTISCTEILFGVRVAAPSLDFDPLGEGWGLMIVPTLVLLTEHAPNTLDDTIECGTEVASLCATHDRLRTIDMDEQLDLLGVLLVYEHHVCGRRPILILGESPHMIFCAFQELVRDFAMSARDLDLHPPPPRKRIPVTHFT